MVKTAVVVVVSMLCGMLQDVDNPQYKHWAKFKKGAYSKSKSETNMGSTKMEGEMTTTLKDLSAEKAVIEMKSVNIMMGTKTEAPPQSMDIPAKVKKTEDTGKKPEMKEGDEEIEVAGKKIKCHWVEMVTEQGGQKTTTKTWTTDEIPGQVAKMEMTNAQMTMKSSVVEFKTE